MKQKVQNKTTEQQEESANVNHVLDEWNNKMLHAEYCSCLWLFWSEEQFGRVQTSDVVKRDAEPSAGCRHLHLNWWDLTSTANSSGLKTSSGC